MSGREAFGPNLRRRRIQQGVSLEQIARATKVSADLWDGLERNDFGRWPTGIFARAYIREYAKLIGVDAESTVDEFCRWFPQGDRRSLRVLREHAQIVGHPIEDIAEEPPGTAGDRREPAAAPPVRQPASPFLSLVVRLRRVLSKA